MDCSDNVYFSRGDMRKLFSTEIKHGDVITVCYANTGNEAFELRFMIDFEARVPNYNWYIDLEETQKITIGDQTGSNIELESDFGKNTLVLIEKTSKGVLVTEKASQLGVNVNGKKITGSETLKDCDFVAVADFFGYYRENRLYFCHSNIRTNGIAKYTDPLKTGTTYPKFVRNTRIKVKRDEVPIKVLDPATIPVKPELNIVTSLMPAIAMFALVVVLRGVMSTTGGAFVLFSICSMGLGVVTSIISIFEKKKK